MSEQLGPTIIYRETSADRDAVTQSLRAGAEGAWRAFTDSNPWPGETPESRQINGTAIETCDTDELAKDELATNYKILKEKRTRAQQSSSEHSNQL